MKRIYISFFTTVTIALTMTLIAFFGRNKLSSVVTMDNNTHPAEQDSTFVKVASVDGIFN
ncbi:hypothetical protein BH10BAC2_BH10BAC2_09980 [soil metagenome]